MNNQGRAVYKDWLMAAMIFKGLHWQCGLVRFATEATERTELFCVGVASATKT